MTAYQNTKQQLKKTAKWAKENFKNDKPAIRQTINDALDLYCRSYDLSDRQRDMLANYACTLHPKD